MRKRKPICHYKKILERLAVLNMSIWDLGEAIERKTGKFVDYRQLHKCLKNGKKLGNWVYKAILEILDITDDPQ